MAPGSSGPPTSVPAASTASDTPPTSAVDSAGNIAVIGSTNEPTWPVTPDAYQPDFVGPFPYSDVTVTKFGPFGETLSYSTWIGGDGTDDFGLLAFDESDRLHIVFEATEDILTTPGSFQPFSNGNDLLVARFDLDVAPWVMLGGGLDGTVDTPNLAGGGILSPGSPTRLAVRGAAAGSTAWLAAGFHRVDQPLLGGTLIPSPDILLPLSTGAAGSESLGGTTGGFDLEFPWPNLPAQTSLWAQVWVYDEGAPHDWSASNGLQLVAQ